MISEPYFVGKWTYTHLWGKDGNKIRVSQDHAELIKTKRY